MIHDWWQYDWWSIMIDGSTTILITIWLWHSQFAMENIIIFKNGKPSISIRAMATMAMLNSQMVLLLRFWWWWWWWLWWWSYCTGNHVYCTVPSVRKIWSRSSINPTAQKVQVFFFFQPDESTGAVHILYIIPTFVGGLSPLSFL